MNKTGQASSWGVIYAVICFIISIVITKLMHPGFFWKVITIVVVTIVGYVVGAKASGDW